MGHVLISVRPKPGFGIGNRNQVLVPGTETKVQFRYRYWSRFFFLNRNRIFTFCVKFRELSHSTRDLYQAEKKITVLYKLINWQNDNFNNFEWNTCNFVHLLSLKQHSFFSQLEMSHVLNGPTAKTNTDVEDLISFSQFLLHDLEKKVQFLMHDKEKRG